MQVFSIILPKLEIYKTIKTFLIKTNQKPLISYFSRAAAINQEQQPPSSNEAVRYNVGESLLEACVFRPRTAAPPFCCRRLNRPSQCLALSHTLHRVLHHCLQLKTPATSTMHHHAAWIARSDPAVCSSCIPPAVRKEVALLTMCSYTAEYIRPGDKLWIQWPWRKQWLLKR